MPDKLTAVIRDLETNQMVIDIESDREQTARLAVFAARRERERLVSRLIKICKGK